MRPFPRLAAATTLLILAASALRAGDLAGSVRTVDGRPLPHIVLILAGPSGSRTIVTGPEGRFHTRGLHPGAHSVAIDAPGFVVTGGSGIVIADQGDATLALTLAAAPVRERVVVAATRSDAPSSNLGITTDVLEGERIAAQEPSDLLNVLQQVPGVAVARTGAVDGAGERRSLLPVGAGLAVTALAGAVLVAALAIVLDIVFWLAGRVAVSPGVSRRFSQTERRPTAEAVA